MDFVNDLKKSIDESILSTKVLDFSNSLNDQMFSFTENGAAGYSTSNNVVTDFNFKISSMRNWDDEKILEEWNKYYYEFRELAIVNLFYLSDVRGGLGERRTFLVIFRDLIKKEESKLIYKLLSLIPEYSRWKNLIDLIDLDNKNCESNKAIIDIIEKQLKLDIRNFLRGNHYEISLLAKWMPSINTSSSKTVNLAYYIANKLKMTPRQYRKEISNLRSVLDVVEVKMSSNLWDKIDYEKVPSLANLKYRNAFMSHDRVRRSEFLENVANGNKKINASVLYPHDILHKYISTTSFSLNAASEIDETVEELWKALPDYVNGEGDTLVVADGSGSMCHEIKGTNITALEVANALAIYFAEHSSGQFKDKYITFSEHPQFVDFSTADTLLDKCKIALEHDEVANTNIEAVFDLILKTATRNHYTQADIPKNIVILSDMEFDEAATTTTYAYGCSNRDLWKNSLTSLFADVEARYRNHGYMMPRLIFWNILSRTNTIPCKDFIGVTLVSGFSTNIIEMIMKGDLDTFNLIIDKLLSPRYQSVMKLLI